MATASPAGSVTFAGAVARPGQPIPVSLPQIAFAGRSNVGKSSLINALVGRRSLARTSRAPGRTREINFFDVEGRYAIADLPGYGFAKVPERVRRAWKALVGWYLEGAERLLGVALLLDARRLTGPDDETMLDRLARLEVPTLIVLTKVDTLGRAERQAAVRAARETLGVPEDQILATSARARTGIVTLRRSVEALLRPSGGRR